VSELKKVEKGKEILTSADDVKIVADYETGKPVYNIYVNDELVGWLFRSFGELHISLYKDKFLSIHIS